MTSATPQQTKGLFGHLFRLLPYILAALLWITLATRGQYYLRKVEDLSLFMFDWLYLKESIQVPGGILSIAGSFLTQFLYLPWLGSLIWVLLLLSAYRLTIRAFNLPEQFKALAIIPAAVLVIGNMSIGYGIFIMRAHDWFFAPVLGYLAALIPLFAAKNTRSVWGRVLALAIWTSMGFILFGAFALAGTLAASCAILADAQDLRKNRISVFITGLVLIILIPLVEYSFFTSYRLADSWTIGLPEISESVWERSVRTPFLLILILPSLMALISGRLRQSAGHPAIQAAVYILSAAATFLFWFNDSNFNTELAMSEAVDRFEWQRVIDIYQKAVSSHAKSDDKAYTARSAKLEGVKEQDERNAIVEKYRDRFFEPTRTMVLYRDLAMIRMNRALDDAFGMKDGGRMQETQEQIPMTYQSGEQFYLHFGLPNLCYRWCLENAVEYGWSAASIRYMSLLAILTGQQDMALKFLGRLQKTLFHRKWSEQYLTLASFPALAAKQAPFDSILPLLCFEDEMSNDLGKCELHLIKHFTQSRPAGASTPEYDRVALFWAMRTQSIPDFWNKLGNYLESNRPAKLPRNVQEAAYLYTSLEKRGLDITYDQSVKDSYARFTQYVSKHQVRDIRESAYPYSQQFGKTFYYFYYFIRDIQTY